MRRSTPSIDAPHHPIHKLQLLLADQTPGTSKIAEMEDIPVMQNHHDMNSQGQQITQGIRVMARQRMCLSDPPPYDQNMLRRDNTSGNTTILVVMRRVLDLQQQQQNMSRQEGYR